MDRMSHFQREHFSGREMMSEMADRLGSRMSVR